MSVYLKTLGIIVMLLITVTAKAQRMPYIHQTDAGVLLGSPAVTSFSAQTFNGVTIRKWNLDAGITTGIDLYSQLIILPVSAGFKWNPFSSHTVSPVVSLNGGYGFGWLKDKSDGMECDGGFIINPSIGLRVKTKSSAKINLAFGFRQQEAVIRQSFEFVNFDYFGGTPELEDEYKFRRLNLSLGLSF